VLREQIGRRETREEIEKDGPVGLEGRILDKKSIKNQ